MIPSSEYNYSMTEKEIYLCTQCELHAYENSVYQKNEDGVE